MRGETRNIYTYWWRLAVYCPEIGGAFDISTKAHVARVLTGGGEAIGDPSDIWCLGAKEAATFLRRVQDIEAGVLYPCRCGTKKPGRPVVFVRRTTKLATVVKGEVRYDMAETKDTGEVQIPKSEWRPVVEKAAVEGLARKLMGR